MVRPSVFVSHGSPLVAVETDSYTRALRQFGECHEDARAIVIVSGHWQRPAPVRVTSWKKEAIIHDFGGFPRDLYKLEYPAPGLPELAHEIAEALTAAGIEADLDIHRGLDHGAWIPARLAWPGAKIPVLQVSLPHAEPAELFELGRALRPFRERNVVLMGSGGVVHNLRRLRVAHEFGPVDRWAEEFDGWVAERLEEDREDVLAYRENAPHADLAVPTTDHFDPLLVTLGTCFESDRLESIYEGFRYGSLSMRSFQFAAA